MRNKTISTVIIVCLALGAGFLSAETSGLVLRAASVAAGIGFLFKAKK